MSERIIFNLAGKVRYATLEGRDHIVVPTVMIVEGVLNGSKGPLYYPAEELAKCPPVWNHKPIVVYHPRSGSATDPDVLNTRKIGVILNTAWDAPKLRTESWIDIAAANRVDKRIIQNLEANKPVEVSTGVFTENEATSGVFPDPNGKPYDAIARNYLPDHLAVLPDQLGACSLADGAGLLVSNLVHNLTIEGKFLDAMSAGAVMGLTGLRPVITQEQVTNEKSFGEISSELYSLIQAKWGYSCYIDAVFDGYFVYCVDGLMYRVDYSASDKEVKLRSDPIEVYRTINYVTANGEGPFETVTNVKPSPTPIKEKDAMNKDQMIAHLIANAGYEESDRKMLGDLPDAKLSALAAKFPVTPIVPPTNNTQTPPPVLQAPAVTATMTNDQYLATLPPAIAQNFRTALKAEAEMKTKLVQEIIANEANQFTADHLNTQSLDQLQGIAAFARGNAQATQANPVNNYFGAGGLPPTLNYGGVNNSKDPELDEVPYGPPTMNFDDRFAKVG